MHLLTILRYIVGVLYHRNSKGPTRSLLSNSKIGGITAPWPDVRRLRVRMSGLHGQTLWPGSVAGLHGQTLWPDVWRLRG